MPPLNRSELARFLSEDLTAAAVMVPINNPIDPTSGSRMRTTILRRTSSTWRWSAATGSWSSLKRLQVRRRPPRRRGLPVRLPRVPDATG
jgi:hypothetical protein